MARVNRWKRSLYAGKTARYLFHIVLLLLVSGIVNATCVAQTPAHNNKKVSPSRVLIKTLVFPGWGHLALGKEHQSRGRWHIGSELALWLGYGGIALRSSQLENNLITQAQTYADIDISNRGQDLWIAIGNYESLNAYNRQQLLNRNWDQQYSDQPKNQWQWTTDQARQDFESTRTQWNRTKQQIPAVLSALILNRVIAGISAYRRALQLQENSPSQQSVSTSTTTAGNSVRWQFSIRPHLPATAQHSHLVYQLQPVIKINF